MASTYPVIKYSINGVSQYLVAEDIIEAEILQEIHPISLELPVSTARVCFHAVDSAYSPFTDGILTNTRFEIYEVIDGAERLIGLFYLVGRTNPKEREVELECEDAIGLLDRANFEGTFYDVPTTVERIIEDIVAPTGIPYTIDDTVKAITLRGYLPVSSVREALQQVLFAAGAWATTAGSNRIYIYPSALPEQSPAVDYDALTDDDKTDQQKLAQLQLVTVIRVIAHDYTKSSVEEEIYSADLEPGDYKILYEKPYHSVRAEGVGDVPEYLATEDNTLLVTEDFVDFTSWTVLGKAGDFEFGSNSVTLHVIEPGGAVAVYGKPYIDSIREFVYNEAEATGSYVTGFKYGTKKYGATGSEGAGGVYSKIWTVQAANNEWNIKEATLVNSDIAQAVLDRVTEYARLRYKQNVTLFPRTDTNLGDLKLVDSLYEKDINGVVERITSNLTGGYLLETEIIGTERIVI